VGLTKTCAAGYGGGVLDDVGQDFLDDAVYGELEPWVRPAASPSVCGGAALALRSWWLLHGRQSAGRLRVRSGLPKSRAGTTWRSVLMPPVVGRTA
jgi:hypothetical protein